MLAGMAGFRNTQHRNHSPGPMTLTHQTSAIVWIRSNLRPRHLRIHAGAAGSRPVVLDHLHRGSALHAYRDVESFYQSRTTGLGHPHPDLQPLRHVQDRGTARVGGSSCSSSRSSTSSSSSLSASTSPKHFGKGVGFGIGLLLLPFIFYPILGFGSATYQGSATPLAGVRM